MERLIFILMFLAITLSCTKDKSAAPCSSCCNFQSDSCNDLPIPPPNIEYSYTHDTSYVRWVYQNPNNSDELLCYKPFTTSGTPQLFKYNIQSHYKQTIYSGQLFFPPRWSKTGWILLNPGAVVFKIKDNGDSLKQLTFIEQDYGPEWNPDGTKFITEHAKGGYYNSIIYDDNGNILDTIINATPSACWQNDSLIIYPRDNGSYGIGITNVNRNTYYDLFNDGFNTGDAILTCFWSKNQNAIYFTTTKGIYNYDVSTKKRTCLKSICSNDAYWSLSSFNSFLLMTKEHQKYIGLDLLLVTSKIMKLNFDGSNEQEIIFQ